MFLPAPLGFGCILVEGRPLGTPPALTVRVLRDGAVVHTIETDVLNAIHRLPPGVGQEWQVELEGNAEVTMVTVAGSPSEIAGG